MASNVIAEISRADLKELITPPVASITDVRHLSSYNWLERPTPTIVVPGSPPLWSAPKVPRQLKKDSGVVYVDQNAARHPESPIEPLFRALFVTNPSFDIGSIDVVTDRNNLRKLLSFVNPGSATSELGPFTINIEVTKNTAIFCRQEIATRDFIGPHDFKGFGHEFEKAFTTSKIKGSTGHHRIVSYRFGGLKFLVRHETDGYVEAEKNMPLSDGEEREDSDLSSILASLSLSSDNRPTRIASRGFELTIKEEGQVVPLESTIEIKTRVAHRRLQIHDVAPQLWASQTPKLVRAYHTRGTFQKPEIEDVAAEIKMWEEANQADLKVFAGLIRKILGGAKACGGNATVNYDGGHKLVVRKVERAKMLPEDLYTRWGDSNVETDTERSAAAENKAGGKVTVCGPEDMEGKDGNHSDMPYLALIDNGVSKGFRQFFRRMPTQLSEYRVLCQSLDSFAVDVTGGRKIRDIMSDMRRGKSDWDPDYRTEIKGLKSLARDSAFRLLYVFIQGGVESGVEDSNIAYNATSFVVSHSRIFGNKTRKMVREAFMDRYQISSKQRSGLDKWPIKDSFDAGSERDEVTTEEEDVFFDSDISF